jgi:DNA-binding CsgD family transcriptional regulator
MPHLTRREREVLDRIAEGMPRAEIARALGISESTVRAYVKSLCGKFHCSMRELPEAVARQGGKDGNG